MGYGIEHARGIWRRLTKEQVVPISDEELQDLPLPTAKAIEIVAFMPLDSVDPLKIGEGYYLTPSGQVAAKPYKLLRMALERSRKVAVAKYACPAASASACSGSARAPSSCTRCAGPTRSARRRNCFRRRSS
ncbi:hypothetical protein GCM10023086_75050 [Streptomyces venetus]|uniref:Ku domain-containing protein n=1 Tax=Streptomyces venetus TaxID=1701086 RepID=A0ABP8HIH0_9ACTN